MNIFKRMWYRLNKSKVPEDVVEMIKHQKDLARNTEKLLQSFESSSVDMKREKELFDYFYQVADVDNIDIETFLPRFLSKVDNPDDMYSVSLVLEENETVYVLGTRKKCLYIILRPWMYACLNQEIEKIDEEEFYKIIPVEKNREDLIINSLISILVNEYFELKDIFPNMPVDDR